jgi:hypothetical protein
MWLWSYVSYFYIQVTQEIGGMCYTTKCDVVEDGLTGRASEGNPRGGKEANPTLSCNPGNVGRNG